MENDLASASDYHTGFSDGWDHGLRLKAQHLKPIKTPAPSNALYCHTCGEEHL